MKNVVNVIAVSTFILAGGTALAGTPGKKTDAACPAACQQQIEALNASEAQMHEQLNTPGKQRKNNEIRISSLEEVLGPCPWYARVGVRAAGGNAKIKNVHADVDGAKVEDEIGFGGAIAFGRQLGPFRAEIELARQGADTKEVQFQDERENVYRYTGEYTLSTIMLNGYYEIPMTDAFAGYVMAGLGYAKYEIDYKVYDSDNDLALDYPPGGGSSSAFAYKAGFGVTYNCTDHTAVDLGYEYLGVADTDSANSINSHNVVLSFRYKF